MWLCLRLARLDPDYLKAFYRRGSAHYALGKYKDALKDFRHVVKVSPQTDKSTSEGERGVGIPLVG